MLWSENYKWCKPITNIGGLTYPNNTSLIYISDEDELITLRSAYADYLGGEEFIINYFEYKNNFYVLHSAELPVTMLIHDDETTYYFWNGKYCNLIELNNLKIQDNLNQVLL